MATIYQRKHKDSDGHRTWVAQIFVGRDRGKVTRSAKGGFRTQAEARDWAQTHETALKKRKKRGERPENDPSKITIGRLTTEFLADPTTKDRRYYGSLEALIAWWVNAYAGERVQEFSVLKIREARTRLQSGRGPATVNRHLSAMRRCWNWGRQNQMVPHDYLWPTGIMLKEPDWRQRFLSEEELQRLLEAARAESVEMHAAVMVSIACGMRQGEMLRLKWSDIDFTAQRVRILIAKNKQSRGVYLPSAAATALKELKRSRVRSVDGWVFLDAAGEVATKSWIEYRWKRVRSAAKLHDFRWHDLRHSCASFLAQRGASLLEIGSVLGHRSASMTRRYSHFVDGAPVAGHAQLDKLLSGK